MLTERTIGGLHDFLTRFLPPLAADARILDVGCGTGAWLERLRALGFSRLEGLDADAGGFNAQGALFHQHDLDREADDLSPLGAFDLISAIEVVEHLENPGNFLLLAERHLGPGGTILMTTPNVHSLSCRLRWLLTGSLASFDPKGDVGHLTPVFLHGFQRMLDRHRFHIQKVWTYPSDGTLIFRKPLWWSARLLRVIARDPLPGDTLCLLIRRKDERASARDRTAGRVVPNRTGAE